VLIFASSREFYKVCVRRCPTNVITSGLTRLSGKASQSDRTHLPFIQGIPEEHLDRIARVSAVAASTGVQVAAHFERIEFGEGSLSAC
jgi:hypothetical protein